MRKDSQDGVPRCRIKYWDIICVLHSGSIVQESCDIDMSVLVGSGEWINISEGWLNTAKQVAQSVPDYSRKKDKPQFLRL